MVTARTGTPAAAVLVAAHGWLWWPGAAAYVRVVRDPEDRLSVSAVHLEDGDRPLSAARLRAVPLGRIEAACASPDLHARLLVAWDDRELGAARPLLALHVLQGLVAGGRQAPPQPQVPAERCTLLRPGPSPQPAFYQQVAREYLVRAAETRSPAVVLAQESGVPVGTVHRWVREARRRGHLPAGRSGRAG